MYDSERITIILYNIIAPRISFYEYLRIIIRANDSEYNLKREFILYEYIIRRVTRIQ